MAHFETYYAVRQVAEAGSSIHLFKTRDEAKAKRDELNAKWKEEWKELSFFWWLLYGCSNLWVIREEQVQVNDPEDFKGPCLD